MTKTTFELAPNAAYITGRLDHDARRISTCTSPLYIVDILGSTTGANITTFQLPAPEYVGIHVRLHAHIWALNPLIYGHELEVRGTDGNAIRLLYNFKITDNVFITQNTFTLGIKMFFFFHKMFTTSCILIFVEILLHSTPFQHFFYLDSVLATNILFM